MFKAYTYSKLNIYSKILKYRANSQTLFRQLNTNKRMLMPKLYSTHPENWHNDELYKYYPEISNKICASISENTIPDLAEYMKNCIEYLTFGGKMGRFRVILDLCHSLGPDWMKKEENERLIHYVGWILEIINSGFFIADDITDGGVLRLKKGCWHLKEGVGVNAVNDVVLLINCVQPLLKKHLKHNEKLSEIIYEYIYMAALGQSLDQILCKKNVSEYDISLFKKLCYAKTSPFVTYYPFTIASTLVGYPNSEIVLKLKPFLMDLGLMYQYQNDYEDCFENSKFTGKLGRDIEDNSCTWLVARTMEIGSVSQKQTMKECYGKGDPDCVMKVKQIYEDLGHQEYYNNFKFEFLENKRQELKEFGKDVPQQLLQIFLNDMFDNVKM